MEVMLILILVVSLTLTWVLVLIHKDLRLCFAVFIGQSLVTWKSKKQ